MLPKAVLMTQSDWTSQRASGGACAASRRCLASRRTRESPLVPSTPTLRRCRSSARGKGRIRCMARTVVARRDHLLLCFTVSMVMIVAGTNFLSRSYAAVATAAMVRRSGARGGRLLIAGGGAHLSGEGRASRLAVGR